MYNKTVLALLDDIIEKIQPDREFACFVLIAGKYTAKDLGQDLKRLRRVVTGKEVNWDQKFIKSVLKKWR